MAVFKSTTFGKISGRYGEALATQSKTTKKNYLRVASVPSNPRTPKQVEHRGKFGYINHVMRPFYPVYKVTFGGNPGIRFGISFAFHNAIIGQHPDYSLDYPKLVFTNGALYQTNQVSAVKTVASMVKIDWNYTKMAGNNPEDQASIIFFNKDTNQAVLEVAVGNRMAATLSVELPEIWIGDTVYCWIYFTTQDGTMNSESQFISEVQL